MLPNYLISVPDAALHRADYFRQHNSDPRNEASESPYRLNLLHSLGAWSEDDLLLCIRRWAPRARWLLIDRDIYGPGFSLAHQLFPGADSQRLTAVNARLTIGLGGFLAHKSISHIYGLIPLILLICLCSGSRVGDDGLGCCER